jgi:hypothetical protein
MDAKAKRKVIAAWLAKLERDLLAAVEKMPEDWDTMSRRGVARPRRTRSSNTARHAGW